MRYATDNCVIQYFYVIQLFSSKIGCRSDLMKTHTCALGRFRKLTTSKEQFHRLWKYQSQACG